jgi:indolepyruvate ferredoxin oxidoreductase
MGEPSSPLVSPHAPVSLQDKYLLDRGRVFLSGRQALVRLPIQQRQLDRARGLNTAGFISGYRGSPLGSYDSELWKARRLLEQHDIRFQPGLNEDLAATAVWGTQQIGFVPGRTVDGVFAIWYGKGPGVDRSGDPFKHANLQGTEPHGGVLLVFGDDHAGKSSSTAHQSDLALAAHDIPILYPASVAEILELGLAGIALSRYSGLLVGLKIVNETADATAVVTLDDNPRRYVEPELAEPAGGVHIRKELLALLEQDARLARYKVPRAQQFARANRLDRVAFGAEHARFLLVTAGKAYADTREALDLLGVDEADARRIGIAVYKPAMIHPLEPEALRAAATAAHEIFFVEEKRAHMERQAASVLFNSSHRCRLSGKTDPHGAPLLPADVPLDPLIVAHALATRLREAIPDIVQLLPHFRARADIVRERVNRTLDAGSAVRRPAFCAGCPHSISTAVPEGSIGMTGIGCHGMAMFMPDRNPLPLTHMGGEGATWLGIAPFTTTKHVFQNLGDGTYNHSGSMAIRAAVQAKARLTYKILYNDAVAMTGGQPVEGGLTVGRIARQVLAEGVASVVVVSDQPERFRKSRELPAGVRALHRDELDGVQRELREAAGVTVLIYDQTCAAEKRRRRKRGQYPDPAERIFINHEVCEGCGDCSVQSNCLAIQPLETELGRKRVIDQSACNKDFSCTKGFCPSFVTVRGGRLRRSAGAWPSAVIESLPEAEVPALQRNFDMLITGVGGTGIVTLSAIVGMAAHLEERGANLYDMTGLSQKGGAVFSHVRLSAAPDAGISAKIAPCAADLVLACDAVAATHKEAIQTINASHTVVIVNDDVSATADFHQRPDVALSVEPLRVVLARASDGRVPQSLPATQLAMAFLGDAIATNMILLGYAWQKGCLPLSRASIERAIELNAVAVELNLRAFSLGRAAAATSADALLALIVQERPSEDTPTADLDSFVARRAADLRAYQNSEYADTYIDLVRRARTSEARLKGAAATRYAGSVARSAFKLMAYKDEYEVARLYADGRFEAALQRQFEGGYRLQFHLAPPLLALEDRRTGRPRKITLGAWMLPVFRGLARLKFLRETPLDIFGYSSERRMERQLRDQYVALIKARCSQLSAENYETSISLAAAPLQVRGFGVVKAAAAHALLAQMKQMKP